MLPLKYSFFEQAEDYIVNGCNRVYCCPPISFSSLGVGLQLIKDEDVLCGGEIIMRSTGLGRPLKIGGMDIISYLRRMTRSVPVEWVLDRQSVEQNEFRSLYEEAIGKISYFLSTN